MLYSENNCSAVEEEDSMCLEFLILQTHEQENSKQYCVQVWKLLLIIKLLRSYILCSTEVTQSNIGNKILVCKQTLLVF